MDNAELTNEFDFELVSPEKKLLSEPATMVVVPGEEGDFGVLVEHAATVSSIRPGVLEVYNDNEEDPKKIFVSGGFVDVTPKSCTLLAEEAVLLKDLDQNELETSLKNLQEDLGLVDGDADKEKVMYSNIYGR